MKVKNFEFRSKPSPNINYSYFTDKQIMNFELDIYHIQKLLKESMYYSTTEQWYLYFQNWNLIGFIPFDELDEIDKTNLINFIRDNKDCIYMPYYHILRNYETLPDEVYEELNSYYQIMKGKKYVRTCVSTK